MRKILLAVLTVSLVATIAAVGTVFYAFQHPEVVGRVAESVLSARLNADVAVEAIAVSVNPLRLDANQIQFRPKPTGKGVGGEISRLRVEASLSGPFGRRTLAVEIAELSGWRIRVPLDLPVIDGIWGHARPSLLSTLSGPLIDFFLFRNVRIDGIQAQNGDVELFSADRHLKFGLSEAVYAAAGSTRLTGQGRFDLPSRQLSFEAPNIRIFALGETLSQLPPLAAELDIQGASMTYGPHKASDISVGGQVFFDVDQKRVVIKDGQLLIGTLIASRKNQVEDVFHNIALDAGGEFDLKQGGLSLPKWRLRLADWLDASGRLTYSGGHDGGVRVDIETGRIAAERLLSESARQVEIHLPGVALRGPLQFEGSLDGKRQSNQWQWGLDAVLNMDDTRMTVAASPTQVRGGLTGSIAFSGFLPDIRLGARLKLTEGDLVHPGIRLHPFSAEVALGGIYPQYTVGRFEARIPSVQQPSNPKRAPIEDVRLRLRNGRVNAAVRSFDFGDVVLSTSVFGPLTFRLKGDLAEQNISFEGRQAGLAAAAKVLGWLPPAFEISTEDRLQATTRCEDGSCRFDARLVLAGATFEHPRWEVLGENVDLEAAATGRLGLGSLKLHLKADVRALAGEALYRRFYINFDQSPLDVTVTAAVDLAAGGWEVDDLSLGLKDIIRLRAQGKGRATAAGRHLGISVDLPQTAIRPLFSHFVQEPFGTLSPFLKTIVLDGELSAAIDIEKDTSGWRATGRPAWSGGSLLSDSLGAALQGVELDFPLLFFSGSGSDGNRSLEGRLNIETLRLPVLGQQTLEWPIKADPNNIVIDTRTRIAMLGGRVALGPLHLQNVYRPERLLKTEISVKSVPSSRFLGAIWPDAPLGMIDGHLDAVTYQNDRLTGKGRITADVFGGRIVLLNPSVEALLSPVPVFAGDVLLEGIGLADLTAGTGFGKIEGILQGSIENLEIVDGQPQRFDLLLETVKTAGVRQRISVKAVNSISQIGGGQNPFIGLAGRAMALLPGFAYKKIGIRASLKNDVFTLNGTIRENDLEYLVRRGGLAGVDVVNRDRTNRIRFKEMVKRIRRTLAAESSPAVKVN